MRASDREINSALRAAFETRKMLGYSLREPVNAFEIASRLGLDVRFLDCPSLEGMYLRQGGPRVFLPHRGHRPRGRLSFTCAHEVGHHQLGHGTTAERYFADGIGERQRSPEEQCADVFAAHLLMPRQSVVERFKIRGVEISDPTTHDCFQVSQELAVGLTTLTNQLCYGLGLLGRNKAKQLNRAKPKALRESIWPSSGSSDLLVLDTHWSAPIVDITIGDYLAVSGNFDQPGFEVNGTSETINREIFTATKRGVFALETDAGQTVEVRVSPKSFTCTYRNSYKFEQNE